MTDRTKPPLIVIGEPQHDSWLGWYVYLHDDTGHERIHGESPEDCIARAWTEYDRITLPARVALLRELAAELCPGRSYPDDYSQALVDGDVIGADFYAGARGCADFADMLRRRADALEAGK